MSVIITGMDMPNNCFGCSKKVNPDERRCDYDGHIFEETLGKLTSRQDKDCPLKSAEGLIEYIETVDRDYRYNGHNLSIEGVIEIIKQYCGMEDKK